MIKIKSYTAKSSAIRAAKAAGISPARIDLFQNDDGTWNFREAQTETEAAPAAADPEAQAAEHEAQRAEDAAAFEEPEAGETPAAEAPAAETAPAETAPAAAEEFPTDNGMAGYIAKVRSGEAETERAAKRAKLKAEAKAKAKGKKAETAAAPAGEERADGLKAGSKLALLADTICRPEGATHAELCQVVGWRTCLPMAMEACKKAEISLRKEKEGNATRYFGTPKAR